MPAARPEPPFSPPTRDELLAAYGRKLVHVVAPGLRVLFCGINPSLYSAAVGHHFARPGNRFWPALHAGGFTPRRYWPWEDRSLLQLGFGLTNIVNRATARADELTPDELRAGAQQLEALVARYRPQYIAMLGISAFRVGFGWKDATFGLQERTIAGSRVWMLPSPSGLNAHYQPARLGEMFAELRKAVEDV